MNEFYKLMDEILDHNRKCDCGEKMWVCYGGGHVWDKCFNCPDPEWEGDIAGYIGHYDNPNESPPEVFETKKYEGYENKSHEQAYRKF